MISDRELLNMAAQAGGISRQWDGTLVDKNIPERPWNPIDDDGDAGLCTLMIVGTCSGVSPVSRSVVLSVWEPTSVENLFGESTRQRVPESAPLATKMRGLPVC